MLILAIAAFWVAAALDVYTTKRAILDGLPGLKERNSVARFFLKWGLPGLVVMKVLIFAPFLWVALQPGLERASAIAFYVMAASQLWAAWNNRKLIRRRKGY